jgi:RNA polymerase sigma-70 factor (ECF subfamily)
MPDDRDLLVEKFEAHRAYLRSVAYRMLGSPGEAEDAVQESWLRLSRADTSEVENLRGWLTTVVARVCLDQLRSRKSRAEEPLEAHAPERGGSLGTSPGGAFGSGGASGAFGAAGAFGATGAFASGQGGSNPEHEALLADSIGVALLVVLETLTPAERVAFVLHDLFALPFDEIAPIVGRSPVAARQLASRARARVQGSPATPEVEIARKREVVDAFLAASRKGDLARLLTLLDPNVVLRADAATVRFGNPPETIGAEAVAATFQGRAAAAQTALLDGLPGAVWAPGGTPRVAFVFQIEGDRIMGIELVAEAESLAGMEVEILGGAATEV